MPREQYEVRWKDYYEILQVHPRAEGEVIAAAYRKLAQMYHPDSRKDDPSASARMVEINEAKEVLSDPQRRSRYDQLYRAKQGGFSGDRGSGAGDQEEEASDWNGNGYENSGWYSDWEADNDSAYSDSYSHDSGAYAPPREYESERVPILSFSFLRLLIFRLLDRICPDPDESQRIMPWPSWSWQRLFLTSSIPFSLLLLIIAAPQGAWLLIIFSILLSGAASYTGITTHWMRATHEAPLAARIAGGACIIISGVSLALVVAYAIFIIIIMVLVFISWELCSGPSPRRPSERLGADF